MADFVLYNYNPSLAAAVVFIVIFGLSAILHIIQLARNRTWYFIPFVIGCLFETIGYIGRAMSAQQAPDFTTTPYVIQSLLLLLGPALYAASIYMVLGRIIVLLGADDRSLIRPGWLTKVFVTGDVLSFLAQSGGGGMLAKAKTASDVKTGENIIVGGLGIQILFFGLFMVVTLIFHLRIRKNPTQESYELAVPWRKLLAVLYATSFLILVRSVFRVAEYIVGKDGVLQSHEYWIYIFDAALMSIVSVLFNWFHPSRVVNRKAEVKRIASTDADGYMMESQPYETQPPRAKSSHSRHSHSRHSHSRHSHSQSRHESK